MRACVCISISGLTARRELVYLGLMAFKSSQVCENRWSWENYKGQGKLEVVVPGQLIIPGPTPRWLWDVTSSSGVRGANKRPGNTSLAEPGSI